MSKLIIVANLIFAAVITGAITLQAISDRNRVIEAAYQDAGNLAHSLAEHTGQTLRALDYVLASVVEEIARRPDLSPEALSDYLRTRRDASLIAYALHVIGPDGRMVASSSELSSQELAAHDFADYPGFVALRDQPTNELYVGPPHNRRGAGAPDQWVVSVSRRIEGPDGSFGGTVAAGLALDRLTGLYETLDLGEEGLVSVLSAEGTTIARYPFNPSQFGQDFSSAHFVTGPKKDMRAEVSGEVLLDGIPRFIFLTFEPTSGTAVSVGLGKRAVLADWYRRTIFSGFIGFLAVALFAAVSLMMVFHARSRARWLQQEADRLRQAQKMEAIGQLTGGLAHDFNNLLTVIIGGAEMLLQDADQLPASARGQVGIIHKAGERAAILTHRLLAFARKQPLAPKPIDVNELITEFEELLQRTLGETVQVEVRCAQGLWLARVDPNELQNAILNLAINARDAMPEGGRLTIETSNAFVGDGYAAAHDFEPGQYVLIAVSDTGTGISAEVLERVFEPFFTTKATGKGSGLGLSMVYGFVKQSGGHVSIQSEPGVGTTLRMYLPRCRESDGSNTREKRLNRGES